MVIKCAPNQKHVLTDGRGCSAERWGERLVTVALQSLTPRAVMSYLP